MWSWSHTAEAYENLQLRIADQDRKWLEVVWGEWKASTSGHFLPTAPSHDFDERRYLRANAAAKQLSTEELVSRIYALAERQSLCTNGGWEAMCCPYHCGVHTLAFSAPRYVVVWDNGHASGRLSDVHHSRTDAVDYGESWLIDMIAADPDPAGAEQAYSYEVIELEDDDE